MQPIQLKFLPPPPPHTQKKKKIQSPVPVSMISTTTFSAVGFSKDTTAEEQSPMQALTVVVSICWGGWPDPTRWNIRSPNCEWNMPLFIIWQVRAVGLKYFAYFFLPLFCVSAISKLQCLLSFFFLQAVVISRYLSIAIWKSIAPFWEMFTSPFCI